MEGYTGYRYSKVGDEIYITKLRCFNEFANPLYKMLPIDFFTTDCIVEEIRNANTGKRAKWIKGKAWFPFRYEEGQRITGTSVYYCKTRCALYVGYLCKSIITGRITDRLSDFLGLGQHIDAGLNYIACSITNNAEDAESLFVDLNGFFLHAEKKKFADETRTLEEILHVDPLTLENVPPELKIEGLSMEELEAAWAEFRESKTITVKAPGAAGTGSDPEQGGAAGTR